MRINIYGLLSLIVGLIPFIVVLGCMVYGWVHFLTRRF